MRIAIDARELKGRPTGVGRFVRELLSAWGHLPEGRDHQFVLCAPEHESGGTAWEQWTLPRLVREAGADVLLAPAYTAPLRLNLPVVLVVHDVSFWAHPEWFSWREGARRRTITRLAARRAAAVITVSEFSKREIVSYLDVDPAKVQVVYHGVSEVVPHRPHIIDDRRRSILFVGSIFNRRHVPALIEAFARLAQEHPDLHLDIVGDNRTRPPVDLNALAVASGVGDRVHIRAYVADDELERLYATASAFVFLSEYEGFGLTPLEAIGAGLPVVVLDTAVAREIYGDAAVFVERPRPVAIAAALDAVLFDPRTRQQLLAAVPAVLERYSWERAARRVLQQLVQAASSPTSR